MGVTILFFQCPLPASLLRSCVDAETANQILALVETHQEAWDCLNVREKTASASSLKAPCVLNLGFLQDIFTKSHSITGWQQRYNLNL